MNYSRYTVTILMLLSVFSASAQQTFKDETAKEFKKLRWLTGTWNRLGLQDSLKGRESWEIRSDSAYYGLGVTMNGDDTVSVEKLKIIEQDRRLYYVADVPENPSPVFFKIVKVGNNYFECENPDHDFPQRISYSAVNKKLRVTITGDRKTVSYKFVKQSR